MHVRATLALLAAAALSGCAGSGGGAPAAAGGTPPGDLPPRAIAIAATDAMGSSVGTYDTYNEATDPPAEQDVRQAGPGDAATVGSGACKDFHEFFAPDRNGDPNSTETLTFYDAACAKLARDGVREYTAHGSSAETVTRKVSYYAMGSNTPIAQRTATVNFENATFGKFGGPQGADGFDAEGTAQLAIAGAQTISTGHEVVMLAAQGDTLQFCGDSAGFNVQGIPPQNEVFGWQGGVLSGGTRTHNSDGSVTWTATRAGTAAEGKPSQFAIQSGSENTACPIATPMWTLTGGTAAGSYSIPTTATYAHGILQQLTIADATLPSGATLAVSTTPGKPISSTSFITGTIAMSSGTIATFGVNAFGDGTLKVIAGGKTYTIVDWEVVS